MRKFLLFVCIITTIAIFGRLLYEIYYNLQLKNIYKQLYIMCEYLNIDIQNINIYINDSYIRYEMIASSYKNMHALIPILEYKIQRRCMIDVDYNYCYIDVQNNALYSTQSNVFNTLNSLNFVNGCKTPISINLLQNIFIQYNTELYADNIIKYIQNITMHIQLLIYTTCNWQDCLQRIYTLIAERMELIWPYSESFAHYINYYSDLSPILIIVKLNNVIIPQYLLKLMNKVGIFITLLSNTTTSNFTAILKQTEWKNRFMFQKYDYITYLESNIT